MNIELKNDGDYDSLTISHNKTILQYFLRRKPKEESFRRHNNGKKCGNWYRSSDMGAVTICEQFRIDRALRQLDCMKKSLDKMMEQFKW